MVNSTPKDAMRRADQIVKRRVTIDRIETLPGGRIKVKSRDTRARLAGLEYCGTKYETVKSLGRGRYIMRRAQE